MIGLVFPIAGIVMLIGIILMALPVIRAAPWGCSPLFEAGLGVFLVGVAIALLGAIGWLICGGFALSLFRYPLSGA